MEMVPQRISFKCTPENFAELCERPGIIPAPYMARAQWVSLERLTALSDAELRESISESYRLVWERLPKKRRAELESGAMKTKRSAVRKTETASRKSSAQNLGQEKAREGGPTRMNWMTGRRRAIVLGAILSSVLLTQTISVRAQSGSASAQSGKPSASVVIADRRARAQLLRRHSRRRRKAVPVLPARRKRAGRTASQTDESGRDRRRSCRITATSTASCSILPVLTLRSSWMPVRAPARTANCSRTRRKFRTAASETVRNSVRQTILVAEIRNKRCGGTVLIDFIFNYVHGEWKLFSIP